ncbi:hypothetical protein Tco_0612728 [Tanacetum coccineum]
MLTLSSFLQCVQLLEGGSRTSASLLAGPIVKERPDLVSFTSVVIRDSIVLSYCLSIRKSIDRKSAGTWLCIAFWMFCSHTGLGHVFRFDLFSSMLSTNPFATARGVEGKASALSADLTKNDLTELLSSEDFAFPFNDFGEVRSIWPFVFWGSALIPLM